LAALAFTQSRVQGRAVRVALLLADSYVTKQRFIIGYFKSLSVRTSHRTLAHFRNPNRWLDMLRLLLIT